MPVKKTSKTPSRTNSIRLPSVAKNNAAAGKKLFTRIRPRFRRFRKSADKGVVARRSGRKLTGSFRLFGESLSLLRQHWKLFGGITLVYLFLSILLVGVLGGNNKFMESRDGFVEQLGQLPASLALFNVLISSSASPASESGAAYQTVIIIIVSLATIWALRQVLAGEKIKIRDAFYQGVYPMVPFILVLLFLGVLLIPLLIAGFVFAFVISGGLAVSILEKAFWTSLILLLVLLSLYWIVNRIFALYIVALPDMKPIAAIKAARKLVVYHRWAVLRRLLFLPLSMFVVGAIIFLPLITYVPVLAQWVFLVLYMFGLVFIHTYAYSLYKELL